MVLKTFENLENSVLDFKFFCKFPNFFKFFLLIINKVCQHFALAKNQQIFFINKKQTNKFLFK